MIARLALIVLPVLAATGDPLAERDAGSPRQCIDTGFAQTVQIVDQRTILYAETARRVWRTGPEQRCSWLEPSATLIVLDQVGQRLCRGDRFRVRRTGEAFAGPVCRFTAFTPFDRR